MSTVPASVGKSSKPPIIPPSFDANQPPTIRLYPLSNYIFDTKETQPEEDASVLSRLQRLENHYKQHGMRRTCEAILVCHEHNSPQVLMLQIANAFFKLPGDYLHPDDDEIEGFKARLNERLAPTTTNSNSSGSNSNSNSNSTGATEDKEAAAAAAGGGGGGENDDWVIGDCVAQWWRPNIETFLYPYLPAHVSRPKELKKLYLIHLPPTKVLAVPKNMKLLAIPLCELYDNTARYGPQLSAIPHYLSRYRFECVNEQGEVEYVMPGAQPLPQSKSQPQQNGNHA